MNVLAVGSNRLEVAAIGSEGTLRQKYLKRLMVTSGAVDQGHSGSCGDPKWLIGKVFNIQSLLIPIKWFKLTVGWST